MWKKGQKVRFINSEKYDNQQHSILDYQRTDGDDTSYFLHYWSWIDEDELILVEDNNMKIEVGNTYKWTSNSCLQTPFTITKVEGNKTWYIYKGEDKEYVDTDISDQVTIVEPLQESAISPTHYNSTKISAIDVITDWDLDFFLGNVLKYIQRHTKKGKPQEDLEKASTYLNFAVQRLKDKQNE